MIVLVPTKIRQSFREVGKSKPDEENAIARKLAEPFAKYAFTHRTIFDHYEVSYAFYKDEPCVPATSDQWGGVAEIAKECVAAVVRKHVSISIAIYRSASPEDGRVISRSNDDEGSLAGQIQCSGPDETISNLR